MSQFLSELYFSSVSQTAPLFLSFPRVWWELWWEAQMFEPYFSFTFKVVPNTPRKPSYPPWASLALSPSAKIELDVLLTPQFHGYYLSWDSKICLYPFGPWEVHADCTSAPPRPEYYNWEQWVLLIVHISPMIPSPHQNHHYVPNSLRELWGSVWIGQRSQSSHKPSEKCGRGVPPLSRWPRVKNISGIWALWMGTLGREWNRGNSGRWNMRYTNGETAKRRIFALPH